MTEAAESPTNSKEPMIIKTPAFSQISNRDDKGNQWLFYTPCREYLNVNFSVSLQSYLSELLYLITDVANSCVADVFEPSHRRPKLLTSKLTTIKSGNWLTPLIRSSLIIDFEGLPGPLGQILIRWCHEGKSARLESCGTDMLAISGKTGKLDDLRGEVVRLSQGNESGSIGDGRLWLSNGKIS